MAGYNSLLLPRIFFGMFLGVLLTRTFARSQAADSVSREAVVAWLKKQEGFVRSCESRFTVRQLPTDPETADVIRKMTGNSIGKIGPSSAIWTKEMVSRPGFSYQVKWWRKGIKERIENYPLESDPEKDAYRVVTAFDGQIVRTMEPHAADGRVHGNIETIRSADWEEMPRVNPYTMIFENYKTPWSTIADQAKEFTTIKERRGGQWFTKITLSLPKGYKKSILLFDGDRRLVERQYFGQPLLGNKPEWVLKEAFSDYQLHEDGSGEVIWFPHRAVIRSYLGRAPDGTLINHAVQEVTIIDLKFNTQIPDSLFDLRIPRDAVVYDGVTNLGFLEPGERPSSLFPEEAARRRWVMAAVIGGLLALGSGAVVAMRKRMKRSAV